MIDENFGIKHSGGTIDLYTMTYKSPIIPTPYKSAEVQLWASENRENLQALVNALQNYMNEKFPK